jgi:D-psicose/D-tagatose/L-ribulose 3-epimerase
MGPDRDLIHSDKAIRDDGMAYVKHCIDAAATLGATNVVGPLYSAVGRTWQMTDDERARDTDLLVKQLSGLAEYAGNKGVVLCVEPLNRFETSFINLASQAIGVVDRVNHPACKIMLDTFHMNIEEPDILRSIQTCGERIFHFHVADSNRWYPGAGHLDFAAMLSALQVTGYRGWVSGEFLPLPDAETAARESITTLRQISL